MKQIELPGESLYFHTLPNGLKIVFKHLPLSYVAHCGLIVHAGSRDDANYAGVAHAMEHMLFKGTQKRKSFHILNRIDSVGGEINAYTTKEVTAIYTSIYDLFLDRAVELLFDIAYHSIYPEKELKKEQQVIKEEIKMYKDSPDENIFDEFQELLFEGHSLATNILGLEKTVDSLDPSILRAFASVFYKPENMVLVIASDRSKEKVMKIIEKYGGETPTYDSDLDCFSQVRKKITTTSVQRKEVETEHVQSYVVLGGLASSSQSDDRLKETMLLNILGGPALNSRLNLAIREKYGYTYHIEAGTTHFSDIGFYHCYAGTDAKHLERTVYLINKEFEKLRTQKMGVLQLHNAINQFMGQIMVAEENKLSSVMGIGRQWLQNEKIYTLNEIMKIVQTIRSEDLLEISNKLFAPSSISSLTYLPSPE
jgi:predicted Zn-dependent peptidase